MIQITGCTIPTNDFSLYESIVFTGHIPQEMKITETETKLKVILGESRSNVVCPYCKSMLDTIYVHTCYEPIQCSQTVSLDVNCVPLMKQKQNNILSVHCKHCSTTTVGFYSEIDIKDKKLTIKNFYIEKGIKLEENSPSFFEQIIITQ